MSAADPTPATGNVADERSGRTLPLWASSLLVFGTSFVTLVLEIVAGRLLAPYVGVTLETFTTIIGVVLAGIAIGTWAGGAAADRVDPQRLLAPLLIGAGLLTFAVIPVIRLVGPSVSPNSIGGLMVLTFLGLFVPAAMLSAIAPAIVKLQLRDLAETGATVGRFSALGTAGALAGSFMTGFVFLARASSTTIVVGSGIAITVSGVAVWLLLRSSDRVLAVAALGLMGLAAQFNYSISGPCQIESTYYCATVMAEQGNESGRFLILDTLRHSYVDLEDPQRLEFGYTLAFADVLRAAFPGNEAVSTLHIGGGGFTFPRWIEAEHPGSESLVLELDPTVVQLVEDEMGLELSDRLRVRTGDARTGVRSEPENRYDIVIGDAFGGIAVPWHLTTLEFTKDVERVMADDGVYVINVIDHAPMGFLRAKVVTLRAVFDHVAVVSSPAKFEGRDGGNFVLVASRRAIDGEAIDRLAAARGGLDVTHHGAQLDDWVGDATVLTDEFAPVDQLLTTS